MSQATWVPLEEMAVSERGTKFVIQCVSRCSAELPVDGYVTGLWGDVSWWHTRLNGFRVALDGCIIGYHKMTYGHLFALLASLELLDRVDQAELERRLRPTRGKIEFGPLDVNPAVQWLNPFTVAYDNGYENPTPVLATVWVRQYARKDWAILLG